MPFINTKHKVTIDTLVEGLKNKLNNPYYIYSDKKATKVTYLNQSKTKSTLDDGTKQFYAPLGDDSPLKYNKIHDAYLYGLDRVQLSLDNGDWGLESDAIEGEAVVLPNTFIPYPNDYFYIDYVNKQYLFKVTNVNMDTLENGSNLYKLSYKLDQTDYTEDKLNIQVAEEFTMIINNIGTQFNAIIRSNDHDLILSLEIILDHLKEYYNNLFFNSKVQTYTYVYDGLHFYDPYMIEFLIRNKILASDKYVYVGHQQMTPRTFSIDYDKTFFRSVELGDKTKLKNPVGFGKVVDDINSLLYTRIEDYYTITYNQNDIYEGNSINTIPIDIIDFIKENKEYEAGNINFLWNIVIKYFNGSKFNTSVVDMLESVEYNDSIILFYSVPMIIFIIEKEIRKLMVK